MKPILIDALHINMGGGLNLLDYLITNLITHRINFFLLKDIRCPKLSYEEKISKIAIIAPDNTTRKNFYKTHVNDFSKVLCFGNIPPQIRMPVPVYTYLHNVSLLKIPKDYSIISKIKTFLKKAYIKFYSQNTDVWIVQTSNTAQLVKKHLTLFNQEIAIYPFYCIPSDMNSAPKKERTDYCFIGDYTNAKGHEYLVEAWIKLANIGLKSPLHLTVSEPVFLPVIEQAQKKGAPIINHGKVQFSEIVQIYNSSKVVIYPSLNESLGLGIVEGLEAGCDIIGSDLPYLHAVCKPSRVFTPCDSDSIVNAVLSYERSTEPHSTLLIRDMIDEFIEYIVK